MSTELAVRQTALPTSFEEISGMAKAFVQSGMFQDTRQVAQAIVKIQAGRELGLAPVYSMQNINLIRNRLTTSANTMAMLVKRSGNYNYRVKEHTDKSCSITFYERDGDKWAEVGESTFTMDDAKRAGLIKPDSGWEKYPRAMLFSRSISQGARMYAPDAIGGVYTDEEIRSIPAKPEDVKVDVVTGEIAPEPEVVEETVSAQEVNDDGNAIEEQSVASADSGVDDAPVTPEDVKSLTEAMGKVNMNASDLGKYCNKDKGWKIKTLNDLKKWQLDELMAAIKKGKE